MLETWLSRMMVRALLMMLTVTTFCEAESEEAVLKHLKYPPIITKQPSFNGEEVIFSVASGQDARDSKSFTIECEAEGNPAPEFRWTKNGKEFEGHFNENRITHQPGKGTLVFNVPWHNDDGAYQCFATNEMGTATSNSVFVREAVWETFKKVDPITMQVNEGEPAELKCQVQDGYPKPLRVWKIQNVNGALRSIYSSRITIDPEGTMWFSNVTRFDASDDFIYACLAMSTFLSEYKIGSRVYLHVNSYDSTAVETQKEPEQQYVSQKNTVILKGKTLRLWCIFSGTPLPEMVWKKRNNSGPVYLPLDRVDYENYGKTLVIQNVDFEDDGQYECEASNGVGVAKSYSMNVTIQAAPYFEREPEIQNKAEGETAEIYCEVGGRPKPTQVWLYNGIPITEAIDARHRVEPNKITIYDLIKADIGNFGCKATNEHGFVYKDVYVNVFDLPPAFLIPPNETRSVDGQDATMTCRVIGMPKPHITWVKDGNQLTESRFQVTDVGDLIIKNVTFTDAGNYVCYAENRWGGQRAEGSISVENRTKITDEPEDNEVDAGQTARFRCNAVTDSDLELSIEWMMEDKLIDFKQEPRFVQRSDYSLSITKTTKLDSGVYTCVASTELDKVTSSATLIVHDVPNSPVMLSVVCNDRDADVEWDVERQLMGDNRVPILGYIIQFNTSFTPDIWENVIDNVPANMTQINLGLSPWTNYTFRVIARNKIGPSPPSDHSGMCTTLPDVPYINPNGVKGKGSTPQNLVIKWTPMPEIEHNGPGFKYCVYYQREDIENAQWERREVVEWEQDHFVVPNQPTFKPYRIKVEAHNDKGQAQVAAYEFKGWSGEDVPTEAPAEVILEEIIDSRSARLAWYTVSDSSVRGHFKGYKIQTWTEDESEERPRDIISETNYAVVRTFVPFTKNFVRVLAFNSAYDGPPSETISFNTPEGKPGAVESPVAIQMGSTAFYLTWKPPKNPNGIINGYHIYHQELWGLNVGVRNIHEPPITDPTITRAKLSPFEPNIQYIVTIYASTTAGEGDRNYLVLSPQPVAATPPGKPSFIWQRIHTTTGVPDIKITWIPNTETNPGSHFFVKYKLVADSMFEETQPVLYDVSTDLKDLEADQTYVVSLVAVHGEFATESDVEEIDTTTFSRP